MNKIPFKVKKITQEMSVDSKPNLISTKMPTTHKNKNQSFKKNKSQTKKKIQIKNESKQKIEDELRKFDLNIKYGPFKGISRLERFERAKRVNLKPPEYIKDYIISNKNYEWAHYEYEF